MKLPLVSVVIPTYNREDYIEECINSAQASSYSNIEIIVIDNASTDKTVEIAEKLANSDDRIKLILNSENIGPVENWRKGVQAAKGKYVKILFSDDLVEPTFINKALHLLHSNSSIGFVYSGVSLIGSMRGYLYCNWLKEGLHQSEKFLSEIAREGQVPYSPGCALLRRDDFLNALFNHFPDCKHLDFTSHGAGPDVGVFVNLLFKYEKFGYLPDALHKFRAHDNSITVGEMQKSQSITRVHWRTRSAVVSLVRMHRGPIHEWMCLNAYFLQTPPQYRTDSEKFYESLGIENKYAILSPIIGKICRIVFRFSPFIWR